MMISASGGLQNLEGDALMESSFRRLVGAIADEREQLRSAWQQVDQERDCTTSELDRLKQDTEEWVEAEKSKIDAEWTRLDTLSSDMKDFWPDSKEIIQINCSGQAFTVPRTIFLGIEGSNLSQMFSNAFTHNIPRDTKGRYFLDFNPHCFAIIVEYLQNRRLRPDAPVPVVPAKHGESMDLLAEALKLKMFMCENQVNPVHGTSLLVTGNMIQAMHPGWQVISSTKPLPQTAPSYFEVKVLSNPSGSGGLAVGLCGHMPAGDEVHSIHLSDAVLYNSHNGLIGDCMDAENVETHVKLQEGDVLGVRNEVSNRSVIWYYNSKSIGTSIIKQDYVEKMRTLYPVFALYAPDTRIQVDFRPGAPPA